MTRIHSIFSKLEFLYVVDDISAKPHSRTFVIDVHRHSSVVVTASVLHYSSPTFFSIHPYVATSKLTECAGEANLFSKV